MAKKSCKKGYYYCYASKKCKKIPMGYVVGMGGWLRKEKEEEKSSDETEGKKKNGNGNGANGNGNGNGGSDGGSNGGGVSEAWSAKYKKSIDCDNPKGFSQRAHCRGRKMSEEVIAEKRDGKSSKDKGYSLRDWFKGGGWVQAGGKYDGKPCARQPGQKTKPFCRDADDRANMSKKERERRAKKKRREDSNPDRKGKAKMVTDNYSNWRNELQLDEGVAHAIRLGLAAGTAIAGGIIGKKAHDAVKNMVKKRNEKLDDAINKARGVFNSYEPEGELVDEGKKDACYHKVKSRYSVWPSAYASGALVKCRKVGAKNWGNKTKKESYELGEMASEKKIDKKIQKKIKSKDLNPPEYIKNSNMMPGSGIPKKLADDYQFSNWRDDFQAMEFESVDIIKAEPLKPTDGIGSRMLGEAKKCWKGYKKVGTQKLFGKTYNRCEKIKKEEVEIQEAIPGYEKYNAAVAAAKKLTGRKKIDALKAAASLRPKTEKEVSEPLGEDWQKSNRNDGVDGMSQKSVDAYKRENPGSNLKTAVTGKVKKGSKDAKRRKSFCSRSKGQKDMHNIDCTKTPDKKICKARKRWKC